MGKFEIFLIGIEEPAGLILFFGQPNKGEARLRSALQNFGEAKAEREGFEPSIPLRICDLSKIVH